ncbi:MAG: rpoB [Candidatus Berkelbacteria bacterium]|nr:rpoB [Candidatus Berkelbacteria bacterium]
MARVQFGPSKSIAVPLPDLIEVQTKSYDWFFKEGIQELLEEINPVDDFTGKVLQLEFLGTSLDQPRFDEDTTREKNLTFQAPLKCQVRLTNRITGKTKESSVFLGDFPLMTDRGTFIINGIERVVVSQIVRSFGVLFVADEVAGRRLFGAKIIPSRGAWLEFETSLRDVISVKVDRKRKILISTFLRALGLNTDQIIQAFEGVNDDKDHDYIKATLARDSAKTYEKALVEVYKRIRPGDLATADTAKTFIEAMFFNPKRYDLGRVGRYKINRRLQMDASFDLKNRILRVEDVVATIKEIITLNNDPTALPDDVDHLKNRRVRAVGELVQQKVRVGLLRMERIIKDRMSVLDPDAVTANQLINARPIAAVLQEFYASSQLSQFMNQTNPLAELEHKRCLSATGPGGLSRERAGFEVRDVHPSHYGRICPIETPEGPNIGLVGYMAAFAKINEYGFLETPYLVVTPDKTGKPRLTDKVVYLDADEEERSIIAPASTLTDSKGYFIQARSIVRKYGKPQIDRTSKIQYKDVSPKQTVSISTALIPFVEHDDATRASMGSNMERQAVPLVRPSTPVIGTGMEESAARDSGQCLYADVEGKVLDVNASEVIVQTKNAEKVRYGLKKFIRSNQGTCLNQRPVVKEGDNVHKGQILADSSATDKGELALGKNVLVAFMSFKGANFEDAIIISEKLVREDIYTSVHIEKYSIEVRDTKLGPELLTRDIPNVGEDALSNLDEQGIIRTGAEVGAGDILIGKISPKGETELSAEEKLLRAIFGEKAKDVKDTSLRLPHGEYGRIVGVKIFSKEAGDELPTGVYQMVEISVAQLRKVQIGDKLAGRHGNKGVISVVLAEEEMPFLEDGTPVDIVLNPLGVISRMNLGQILETHLGWAAHRLNYTVAVPVFEGVDYLKIQAELQRAGLPADGKVQLFDGRTGEPFDQKTTVGIIYMMKLCHMVDDKMHARSTGPYSMVTQQPLGGKAQFGGQRFGEMEVWALEAYGAAHTLQEMLTIKSDDVIGRSKAYEAIIKGEPIQKPQIPASFYVLVKELQSLGLNVEMLTAQELSRQKKVEAPVIKDKKSIEEIVDQDEDVQVTELNVPEPAMVEKPVDDGEE